MPRAAIELFHETFGTTPRAAASATGRGRRVSGRARSRRRALRRDGSDHLRAREARSCVAVRMRVARGDTDPVQCPAAPRRYWGASRSLGRGTQSAPRGVRGSRATAENRPSRARLARELARGVVATAEARPGRAAALACGARRQRDRTHALRGAAARAREARALRHLAL